jgi:hypothetical protein
MVLPSGKLPPVFAVLLYNGRGRWDVAQDVADLVETVPGGLERYRPHLRYFLLDEGRIADSLLESLRNLAAALFRLERCRGPEDVQRVLVALSEWLKEPEHAELHRAFTVWLSQVLLPARMPGAEMPKVANLQEVRSMLAERDWTREWIEQGSAKTRREDLSVLRASLLRRLALRFGPMPDSVRERLETIDSMEKLMDLAAESAIAPSLSALGLVPQ